MREGVRGEGRGEDVELRLKQKGQAGSRKASTSHSACQPQTESQKTGQTDRKKRTEQYVD
jgi:hypothetical protein